MPALPLDLADIRQGVSTEPAATTICHPGRASLRMRSRCLPRLWQGLRSLVPTMPLASSANRGRDLPKPHYAVLDLVEPLSLRRAKPRTPLSKPELQRPSDVL